MLCYKDTTYCCSPKCTNECGRKLTTEIEAAAERWWLSGGGEKGQAPISTSFFCGGEPPAPAAK